MKLFRKEDFGREADVEPLDGILDEVARDAASLHHEYLDETIVPEGGE